MTALPKLPKLPSFGETDRSGRDKRTKPRITIHEINKMGADAIKDYPEIASIRDDRATFEKVLDWIDLPRNVVANVIGEIAGVDTSKSPRGSLGLKRVYMSDVLGKLGVKPGALRSVVGFVGDLAIDPLTYLSAGAATGTKVASHTPKYTKAGMDVLKGAAKTGKAGGLLTKALGGGRAGKRLASIAARKGGPARLMGKKGGKLADIIARNVTRGDAVGDAARTWLTKYGIEGRKLFRVPFTQLAGPTLKVGKQAKLYKALNVGERGRQYLKRVQDLSRAGQTATKAQQILRNLREARQAGKTDDIARLSKQQSVLRKQLAGQLAQAGVTTKGKSIGRLLREARKARIMAEHSPDAPAVMQFAQEAALGKRRMPGSPGSMLSEIFGPGRSPLRSRELAIDFQQGMGSAMQGNAAFARMQPLIDDAAASLAKKGHLRGNEGALRRMLRKMLDVGTEDAAEQLYTSDAGRKLFTKARRKAIAETPEYRKLLNTIRSEAAQNVTEAKQLGARPSVINETAYLARPLSDPAKKAVARQSAITGGEVAPALEGFKATVNQPSKLGRSRMMEFISPTGDVKAVLNTQTDKIDDLLKQGYTPTRLVTPPGAKAGRVARNMPQSQIDDLLKQGYKIEDKTWPVSLEEMQRRANRGELRKILGPDFKGDLYNMDTAAAFGKRASQQERLRAGARINDLVQQYAVPIGPEDMGTRELQGMKVPEKFTADSQVAKLFGIRSPAGKRLAYPTQVADMLDRLADTFQGTEGVQKALSAVDATMAWFKRWALFHPSYVIRNVWQNSFGTLMAGGNPVRAAQLARSKKIGRVVKAIEEGTTQALQGSVKVGNRQIPLKQIAKEAIEFNMAGAGKSTANFAPHILRRSGQGAAAARRAGEAGKRAIDSVRNWNAAMETRMRLGTFLDFMGDGMNATEAAQKTLLAMPDLSDITQFERAGLARVFPWYRWMKGNGALQLFHYLPQKPAWMAVLPKFRHFVEGASALWRDDPENVPVELRPEWQREAQGAQIFGDRNEGSTFLLRNWFPFEEPAALASMATDPRETMRTLLGQTRPGIKYPIETATGMDLFRQRPVSTPGTLDTIKDIPGALSGSSGTALDNLLAMRPVREYGRRVWEQPSAAGKVSRAVLGGAMQPISRKWGLHERDLETAKKISELRRLIIRARENQNEPELRDLLRQFMRLQAERMRLGLQVPRDTERTFNQLPVDTSPAFGG